MAQRYPLPITVAMLAVANQNAALPRYSGAGVAGDWIGGASSATTTINANTATVAIGRSDSAQVETDYDPQHQKAKANDMVPPLTILADIGQDYGPYAGAGKRTGTIAPRQPYPSVLP